MATSMQKRILVFFVSAVAIIIAVNCRSYNNGLVFYDVETHLPYLPPTVSVSRGRSLANVKYSAKGSIWSTFGKPCDCLGAKCGCCAEIKVNQFRFEQKMCANVTFVLPKEETTLEIFLNEVPSAKYGISLKDPEPFCIPVMMTIPMAMCVQMSNIGVEGNRLNMCMDFIVRLASTDMFEMHFQCMNMGLEGFQYVDKNGMPVIPANGMKAETLKEVESGEYYDEAENEQQNEMKIESLDEDELDGNEQQNENSPLGIHFEQLSPTPEEEISNDVIENEPNIVQNMESAALQLGIAQNHNTNQNETIVSSDDLNKSANETNYDNMEQIYSKETSEETYETQSNTATQTNLSNIELSPQAIESTTKPESDSKDSNNIIGGDNVVNSSSSSSNEHDDSYEEEDEDENENEDNENAYDEEAEDKVQNEEVDIQETESNTITPLPSSNIENNITLNKNAIELNEIIAKPIHTTNDEGTITYLNSSNSTSNFDEKKNLLLNSTVDVSKGAASTVSKLLAIDNNNLTTAAFSYANPDSLTFYRRLLGYI